LFADNFIRNLIASGSNNKVFFGTASIIIAAFVVDTSLNKISDLFTGQMPLGWRFSVFAIIGAIYLAGQFLVLGFVKRKSQEIGAKEKLHLNLIHKMVIIIQCSLTATLLFVVLEMFTLSFYNVGALIVAMAISYILAGFMMGLLARRFFSWFRIRRNFAVLFYGLSSASLAINSVLTLILVSILGLDNPAEILSTHTNSNPPFFIPGSPMDTLNSVYIISSVMSFILTWVATALLLHHYSRRFGRVKYWVIVSLPLVYFRSQFVSYSLNLFASLLSSDPIFYGTLLSVLFTVSKAAGGILFGVAFWIMARNIRQGSVVRDYMIVSAFGFALLFVSNQAIVLSNTFYPPFGLATVSFMGLSCYLILVGIYSSAISVSEDSIRQSIRTFAIKESRLLDSIGMAEMEQQIQKKVVEFTKRNQDRMAEETGIQSSLSEEDVKVYLQQVIREVKKQKTTTNKTNNGNT
jgi:MFS family permease